MYRKITKENCNFLDCEKLVYIIWVVIYFLFLILFNVNLISFSIFYTRLCLSLWLRINISCYISSPREPLHKQKRFCIWLYFNLQRLFFLLYGEQGDSPTRTYQSTGSDPVFSNEFYVRPNLCNVKLCIGHINSRSIISCFPYCCNALSCKK